MASKLTLDMKVPFSTERQAEIAYNSLRVDKEPKRNGVSREMHRDGNQLIINWQAPEARTMRVSVNGFLDHLALVIETISQFDTAIEAVN